MPTNEANENETDLASLKSKIVDYGENPVQQVRDERKQVDPEVDPGATPEPGPDSAPGTEPDSGADPDGDREFGIENPTPITLDPPD